jgi:hypothetical protein
MLLTILFQRGICITGPKIRGFRLPRPKFVQFSTRPPKGTSLRQNTRFEPSTMKIDLFVRAVREPKKIIKKIKKDNNVIFHVYAGAEPLKVAS